MQKRVFWVIVAFAVFLFLLSSASASSIEPEIKKLTTYAQDYETGNINYVQFLAYSSAVREKINEALGATNKENGGVLNEGQLKSVFGEPTETTRWVWFENEQREENMKKDIPAWRKIIFDGKKIQLWMGAWPNLIKKENEERLVYHLNIDVQFKKPEEQLAISDKISEVKELADAFNKEPSTANAEKLAEKSVGIEKMFEMYMRQNQGKCSNIMDEILGSENKRGSQKTLVQEIELASGDNFMIKGRLELCDECEWHWINLDFWFEGRGPGFKQPKTEPEMVSWEQFKNFDDGMYKEQIARILDDVKKSVQEGNYDAVMNAQSKIKAINEAWNQKSNNVWEDVNKIFEQKRKSMSQQEQEEYNKNYGWIRDEQEKKKQVQEIADKNYEKRKEYFLSLFSGYDKKEYYFTQDEYEKRLIEEFVEFGQEICDNNQDDNKNEKTDCDDEQCSGKICGKQTVKATVDGENGTIGEDVLQDMYCIAGTCQAREEGIKKEEFICGNHICDENETIANCAEDCSACKSYDAINCSGNVIFKGKDNNGCPLEPICIVENNTCSATEECSQPLCGKADCVEGMCKTIELGECKEPECVDGEEKVKECNGGEKIVFEKCIEGLWKITGASCEIEINITNPTTCDEYCASAPQLDCEGSMEISGEYPNCVCNKICKIEGTGGDQCSVREDCGSEDDVCSNGKCVTIPKTIVPEEPIDEIVIPEKSQEEQSNEEKKEENQEEKQEQQEEKQEEQQQEQKEEKQEQQQEQNQEEKQEEQSSGEGGITGNVISAIKKFTGMIITGFEGEEGGESGSSSNEGSGDGSNEGSGDGGQREEQPQEPPQEDRGDEERRDDDNEREDREREDEERKEEERERQKENCKQGCEEPCRNMLIAPCVDKCVREADCSDEQCTNSKINECEGSCKQEKDFEGCVKECSDKCMQGKGQDFKMDGQKEEQKMEKGVFKIGGACRTAQGQQKTESFIYFDGWGEPFDKLRNYKQKYYNGGQADWCKEDLVNLLKQRKEFEKGFNEEFVKWFFEKYVANSANDWETHVSGIFELYWKDVDNSKQIAERMNCLEIKELPEHNLINIKYETEFGKIEFWEELKTTKIQGIDNEVQIISPYMKIWIFPPKEFIVYQMKESMKTHELPGPSDETGEKEIGPKDEEKEMIKQNTGFMEKIKKVSEKYGGNVGVAVKFMDYEKNEAVFNLYVQVNEEDIIKVEPMPIEEIPEKDIEIEMDFEKLYEIIYTSEKEMRGEQLESPPWDRQVRPVAKVKEVINGAKMYLKARSMMNSAKISPEGSEKDVKALMKQFFSMAMKGGADNGEQMNEEGTEKDIGEEKDVWEEKGKITGEIISNE